MSEILGVLFAVFVGIMMIPNLMGFQQASSENIRAAATAQQQKDLLAAATIYNKQNALALQAAATASSPVVISVAMLQAPGVNLLPASFSAQNPYGQTWQIEVLQPSPAVLQSLAMSTGGEAISDKQAAKIASMVGASGGFIPQNDSGTFPGGSANAYGAYSGWKVSMNSYVSVSGGHPAALLTLSNGQLVSNYLYRNAVPGQPQLNQMNTAIDMNANNINNVSTLGANAVNVSGTVSSGKFQVNDIVTAGATCGSNALLAQDGNGALMSCQSGTWQMAGDGKCVATSSDLNYLDSDGRCYNGQANANSPAGGDWIFVEVSRHVNHSIYYTSQRVVGMTGSSVGKIWNRNQQSGTAGTGWSAWVQQADLIVSSVGSPCSTNTALAQTAGGASLICQGGNWVGLADRMGNFSFQATTEIAVSPVSQGATVNAPTCYANGVPKIYLIPKSDDNIGYVNHFATGSGPWYVYAQDGNGNPLNSVMLAQTYCYYL